VRKIVRNDEKHAEEYTKNVYEIGASYEESEKSQMDLKKKCAGQINLDDRAQHSERIVFTESSLEEQAHYQHTFLWIEWLILNERFQFKSKLFAAQCCRLGESLLPSWPLPAPSAVK
jgi:hypothetical protein